MTSHMTSYLTSYLISYVLSFAVGSLNNNRSVACKTYAWRPLACLPIIKSQACTNGDENWLRHRRIDVFHRSLDIIVAKVNELCSKNIFIRFADNLTRESRVSPHFCSADGMEMAAITMCPTGDCLSCTCPADELDNTEDEYPCRPSAEIKDKVREARERFLDQDGNIKPRCKEQVSHA